MQTRRVLFLDTQNANRARMAAALLAHLGNAQGTTFSAGPGNLATDPPAAQALREIDVDLAGVPIDTPASYIGQPFDLVITICDGETDT